MKLQINRATAAEQLVLENLLELYLYDFSEFEDGDVGDDGRYGYEYIGSYFTDLDRYPFLVRVDGKLAGFALVRDITLDDGRAVHWMAEFFVMRKYRRKKVGWAVAQHVFTEFSGWWWVAEIEPNRPAQAFWRGVIGNFTGGNYMEITLDDWEGPVQEFFSPGRKEGQR